MNEIPEQADGREDVDSVLSPDTSATLEDLLTRVAGGDRTAFAGLYDRVSPRVFGLARRLLIDVSQSEEVTQEVFLEIWQSASRYDVSKGGAMGWILTMTHRRTVDRIRASQASRDRDLRIGIRDFAESIDDVADAVETVVENAKVREAMSRLTELQRTAISLAYYGGLTQREIADQLQVPIGTIKTRLRDGMIRLRDEMGVAS